MLSMSPPGLHGPAGSVVVLVVIVVPGADGDAVPRAVVVIVAAHTGDEAR